MSAALETDESSDDIGTRLRLVRQIYGLTQRELARRAGVTNGAISLIEQNRVSPSISSLKKILDGIPLSLADFFTLNFASSENVFFSGPDLTEIAFGDATSKTALCRCCAKPISRAPIRARRCCAITARNAASLSRAT